MSFKKLWVYTKQFFHFIWYGEGLLSWITCFIFAFIVIRYLFYPSLGLLLGTSFPVVAVMSESMQHNTNFENWWDKNSCCDLGCTQRMIQGKIYESEKIKKEEFQKYPFNNGFNPGDIIVLYSPKNLKVGDVIVFMSNHRQEPIIHRVIEVMEDGKFYKTKGDNNCGSGDFELRIAKSDIMGKAEFVIPYLGWLKLALVKLIGVF
ncbi:signal peptidase I [Candidatus Woesearchaeota archaeon]|nr:signal peptidase I [Candidatus Woesearchaeota archaeon]